MSISCIFWNYKTKNVIVCGWNLFGIKILKKVDLHHSEMYIVVIRTLPQADTLVASFVTDLRKFVLYPFHICIYGCLLHEHVLAPIHHIFLSIWSISLFSSCCACIVLVSFVFIHTEIIWLWLGPTSNFFVKMLYLSHWVHLQIMIKEI